MQSQPVATTASVSAVASVRISPLIECDVGAHVLDTWKTDRYGDELQRVLASFINCFTRPLEQYPCNADDRKVIETRRFLVPGIPGMVTLEEKSLAFVKEFSSELGLNEFDVVRLMSLAAEMQTASNSSLGGSSNDEDLISSAKDLYFSRRKRMLEAIITLVYHCKEGTVLRGVLEQFVRKLRSSSLVRYIYDLVVRSRSKYFSGNYKQYFQEELHLFSYLLFLLNSENYNFDANEAKIVISLISSMSEVAASQGYSKSCGKDYISLSLLVICTCMLKLNPALINELLADVAPDTFLKNSYFAVLKLYAQSQQNVRYICENKDVLDHMLTFSNELRSRFQKSSSDVTTLIIPLISASFSSFVTRVLDWTDRTIIVFRISQTDIDPQIAFWRMLVELASISTSKLALVDMNKKIIEKKIARLKPSDSEFIDFLKFVTMCCKTNEGSNKNRDATQNIRLYFAEVLFISNSAFCHWDFFFSEIAKFCAHFGTPSRHLSYDESHFNDSWFPETTHLSISSLDFEIIISIFDLIKEIAECPQSRNLLLQNQQFEVIELLISTIRCSFGKTASSLVFKFRTSVLNALTAFIRNDAKLAQKIWPKIHAALISFSISLDDQRVSSFLVEHAISNLISVESSVMNIRTRTLTIALIDLLHAMCVHFCEVFPLLSADNGSFYELHRYIRFVALDIFPTALSGKHEDWPVLNRCLLLFSQLISSCEETFMLELSQAAFHDMKLDPRGIALLVVYGDSKFSGMLSKLLSDCVCSLSIKFNDSNVDDSQVKMCLESCLLCFKSISDSEILIKGLINQHSQKFAGISVVFNFFEFCEFLLHDDLFVLSLASVLTWHISDLCLHLILSILMKSKKSKDLLSILKSKENAFANFRYRVCSLLNNVIHESFNSCLNSYDTICSIRGMNETFDSFHSSSISVKIIDMIIHHANLEVPNLGIELLGFRCQYSDQGNLTLTFEGSILQVLIDLADKAWIVVDFPLLSEKIFEVFQRIMEFKHTASIFINFLWTKHPYLLSNALLNIPLNNSITAQQAIFRFVASRVLSCISHFVHYQIRRAAISNGVVASYLSSVLSRIGLQNSFGELESQKSDLLILKSLEHTDQPILRLLTHVFEPLILEQDIGISPLMRQAGILQVEPVSVRSVLEKVLFNFDSDKLKTLGEELNQFNLMQEYRKAQTSLFNSWVIFMEIYALEYEHVESENEESLLMQFMDFMLVRAEKIGWTYGSPGITRIVSALIISIRNMRNKKSDSNFFLTKKCNLSWYKSCLLRLKATLERSEFATTRSYCSMAIYNVIALLKEYTEPTLIEGINRVINEFFLSEDWCLALRSVFQNLIEGSLECQTSSCVFLNLYLQICGRSGFQVLNSSLRGDWLLRTTQILEICDSSYARLMISPDRSSIVVLSQFKSLLLLLHTISEISAPELQDARLLETLTQCRFLVTSPISGSDYVSRDETSNSISAQIRDESLRFYYEIMCPCLQLLTTILAVDGGYESGDNLGIQLVFQNKNLHHAIFNFFEEHSESLMIPVLELRDSSELCLRTVDALFEIIKELSQSSFGLPESTLNILRRCPLVCRQFCENFVLLVNEFSQSSGIASKFDFSLSVNRDILDLHVKIISNLLSIFLTGNFIGYDLKVGLAPFFLNACEVAGSLLMVHFENLGESGPPANLEFHLELLWRFVLLILETINSDASVYLSERESTARRVFSHLKRLQSVRNIKSIEAGMKRFSSLLSKLTDVVLPDEFSRSYSVF